MSLLTILTLYCVSALIIKDLKFDFSVFMLIFNKDLRTTVKFHSSAFRKRVQRHWKLILIKNRHTF